MTHVTTTNPFAELPGARENSCYGREVDGELVVQGSPPPMAGDVHHALRAVLHDPAFPCVGAKSVLNQSGYRFGLYPSLASPETTAGLAHDLFTFIQERPSIPGAFTSFIATFLEPKVVNEVEFEQLLWKQLEALHRLDAVHHDWSPGVSSDVTSPAFSYSFGGHPFFIVGLSPAADRWARRFPWPVMVFNDHNQFEQLRSEQRFERIRDLIHERDATLHGSANPMLEDFGTHSEARQYAGRDVGDDWECPVRFPAGDGS